MEPLIKTPKEIADIAVAYAELRLRAENFEQLDSIVRKIKKRRAANENFLKFTAESLIETYEDYLEKVPPEVREYLDKVSSLEEVVEKVERARRYLR